GMACGIALSLEQMLGGPVSAAGPRFQELVSNTVLAVLAETTGAAAISPAIAELARGVTMTTTNLRILAAIGVILGLVGGAGAGIYLAAAAEQPATKVARNAPAAPPANAGNPIDAQPAKEAKPATEPEDATTGAALLALPFGDKINGAIPLQDLLEGIERRTELLVRVDVAAFKRMGLFVDADGNAAMNPEQFLKLLYQTSAFLPRKTDKLAIRDILNDALAQVPLGHPVTYQVRGNQLVIVPAYVPPLRPGHDPLHPDPTNDEAPALTERMLSEQIYGGVVQVAAERKPLAEILADLRKQTGANIVLDPRCEAERGKATAVTVSLNDVRLYDALRVIADMAELKMVYAGNIYYVTTPENAKAFQPQPQPNQPLFPQGLGGVPTAPPPAGK
ncbi:MAG TPA: hypothetical protein VLM40_18585, partial [Gemmata sp.]|nr:hypothetical protein [Gemmata sp.]